MVAVVVMVMVAKERGSEGLGWGLRLRLKNWGKESKGALQSMMKLLHMLLLQPVRQLLVALVSAVDLHVLLLQPMRQLVVLMRLVM